MIFQLNLVFAIATPLSTPLAEESQSVRAYFLRALAHRCGVIQLECGCTKWVPTNYQWSYNLFEWPYRVLNPTSGGLTLLIIRMGPLCKIPVNLWQSRLEPALSIDSFRISPASWHWIIMSFPLAFAGLSFRWQSYLDHIPYMWYCVVKKCYGMVWYDMVWV